MSDPKRAATRAESGRFIRFYVTKIGEDLDRIRDALDPVSLESARGFYRDHRQLLSTQVDHFLGFCDREAGL